MIRGIISGRTFNLSFSDHVPLGDTLLARTWFGQFRGLVLKCAVRNIERAVEV